MIEFLKGAALGVVLVFAGFLAIQNWDEIVASLPLAPAEATPAEKYLALRSEIKSSVLYAQETDHTSELKSSGADVVISAVEKHVRETLLDPESAQFDKVILAYHWKERQLSVCGFVNGKNRLGGYVGFQPFSVEVPLAASLEHLTPRSPTFFDEMGGKRSNRLSKLEGYPGTRFKEWCGLGFALDILASV